MTTIELKQYEDELYCLQVQASIILKGKINLSRNDRKEIKNIGKRIKEIKKILESELNVS